MLALCMVSSLLHSLWQATQRKEALSLTFGGILGFFLEEDFRQFCKLCSFNAYINVLSLPH